MVYGSGRAIGQELGQRNKLQVVDAYTLYNLYNSRAFPTLAWLSTHRMSKSTFSFWSNATFGITRFHVPRFSLLKWKRPLISSGPSSDTPISH